METLITSVPVKIPLSSSYPIELLDSLYQKSQDKVKCRCGRLTTNPSWYCDDHI